jgi:hypothetical protein
LLGNIQAGHYFDSAADRRGDGAGQYARGEQDSIQPIADQCPATHGLEMYIARALE